jgi:hypothetical protein
MERCRLRKLMQRKRRHHNGHWHTPLIQIRSSERVRRDDTVCSPVPRYKRSCTLPFAKAFARPKEIGLTSLSGRSLNIGRRLVRPVVRRRSPGSKTSPRAASLSAARRAIIIIPAAAAIVPRRGADRKRRASRALCERAARGLESSAGCGSHSV